jgi:hypothetical protein
MQNSSLPRCLLLNIYRQIHKSRNHLRHTNELHALLVPAIVHIIGFQVTELEAGRYNGQGCVQIGE